MQTNFTAAQLADPQTKTSEKILRSCVHCGFCTATCPTYLTLGDELDSPRGRIYLIKDMLESGKAATKEVVTHIDRCLSCLSCMTTCPSGVHYMHLVDHARAHIEKTYDRPWHDRFMRWVLAQVLPYPGRFRAALTMGRWAKPVTPLLARVPVLGPRIAAMLDLVPVALSPAADAPLPPIPARRGRVALMGGCGQRVLDPGINAATLRVLHRHGIEVVHAAGEGCCGALVHHLGREDEGHAFAKRNIDAWIGEMDGSGLDAIVITTSGCGTTVKDYGFMFRDDPNYAQKAARVSGLAKDVSEYLLTLDLSAPAAASGLKVAYHSACSMQHGQKLVDQPKALLRGAGFKVVDVPEGHLCCGSAGTYNILQPQIAASLRQRKTKNIRRVKPDLVATGNIGCMTQIAKGFAIEGTPIPIVHTVELIDWATGGPKPAALDGLAMAAAAKTPDAVAG